MKTPTGINVSLTLRFPVGVSACIPSPRLRNPRNPHINLRHLIPGRIIRNPGLGQVEYPLEDPHRTGRGRPVDAVGGNGGDGGIVPGDPVQLGLELPDLVAGGAYGQVIPGPGGGHAGDELGGVDIHIVSIIIPYDLNGRIPFLAQVHGAPLAQAVAGDPAPVAVGGENGLAHPGP